MAAKTVRLREEDPRFQRSLTALIDAITDQIDGVPLSDISITRVVEAAGVTRPTFYQHFADIPEAARRAALVRLSSSFPIPAPAAGPDDLRPQAIRDRITGHTEPVLSHLLAHRNFYLRVLEEATNVAFFEEIISFVGERLLPEVFELAARGSDAARRELTVVTAGGVTWLVIRWLRGESDHDPAEMARRCASIALMMMKTEA
ncbi:TetR/AcrR family transcriptional regulator [Shinella sp. NM-101]|uniref:TetR/AcrR family transcriptional regulator n=1 Tax=Shinella sp. NM-101 TaxID=2744455 RepID=UPI001F36CE14|nr:TetR-like C-terminal domain-containing protein [Shinella sp. NM-101]